MSHFTGDDDFRAAENTTKDEISLEQTIALMTDANGACFDPRHYHSFRGVSFVLPLRECGVCSQRFGSVSPFSSKQVVQCLACKVFFHRNCAMSKNTKWAEPCPVNQVKFDSNMKPSEKRDEATAEDGEGAKNSPTKSSIISPRKKQKHAMSQQLSARSDLHQEHTSKPDAIFRTGINPISPRHMSSSEAKHQFSNIRPTASDGGADTRQNIIFSKVNSPFLSTAGLFQKCKANQAQALEGCPASSQSSIKHSQTWNGTNGQLQIFQNEHENVLSLIASSKYNDEEEGKSNAPSEPPPRWTIKGPPAHWADGNNFHGNLPSKIAPLRQEKRYNRSISPVTNYPFASISRTLHENILVHFRPVVNQIIPEDLDKSEGGVAPSCEVDDDMMEATAMNEDELVCESKGERKRIDGDISSGASSTDMECLLNESEQESGNGTTDHRRLGLATVAGGIAGGVAGLAVAGPVGWVIGAKLGQTAGILGVVLEGSWTIGVVTSGIMAGSNAGQQIQEKLDEKRVLALGGSETTQGVLLVRPSIIVDPAWSTFCEDARKSHRQSRSFALFPNKSDVVNRDRYEREQDIVNADEIEIPTADKILLLVSRILNDKESLPGHVYRCLIEKVKQRAEERGRLSGILKSAAQDVETQPESDDQISSSVSIRARRQDAQAVIKYVTATLLEVRPGFASSPTITEYTATAVEALVFGEIYDLVIEEMEAEFDTAENDLFEKICAFERSHGPDGIMPQGQRLCSEEALKALHRLPEAHSAVDKLRNCVDFLEQISDFFSKCSDQGHEPMGADSLLKLVCQHIVSAKVFGINSQVAFIEEFARDEQLLRGKEGYALVTLQASLHFLNSCSDLDSDIFGQDDN